MSKASYRRVKTKQGSGRFNVSEGVAPAEWLFPHPGLPTIWTDPEDDRFEVVIPQGTILTVVHDTGTDGAGRVPGSAHLAPCNGSGSGVNWDDNNDDGAATPGGGDAFTVAARSVPIGCANLNLYRPFDKDTSQGAGWVAKAYVEWPMIDGLNDDVVAGDLIGPDALGRPVVLSQADAANYPWLIVGRVVKTETFSTDYDFGLLQYMQIDVRDLPSIDNVYSITAPGANQGLFGVRSNLDVEDAVGAFRVNVTL